MSTNDLLMVFGPVRFTIVCDTTLPGKHGVGTIRHTRSPLTKRDSDSANITLATKLEETGLGKSVKNLLLDQVIGIQVQRERK